MSSPKYTYNSTSSPWSKKFLITSWSFQVFYPLLLTIITSAFVGERNNYGYGKGQRNYDDGFFEGMYLVLLICTGCFTGIQIIFFIPQIIRYRQDRLHPLGVLIMAVCSEVMWLAVFSLAILAVAVPWVTWDGLLVLLLFHAFVAIPATVHLVYAGRVYHGYRKAERCTKPIDLENLENFDRTAKN